MASLRDILAARFVHAAGEAVEAGRLFIGQLEIDGSHDNLIVAVVLFRGRGVHGASGGKLGIERRLWGSGGVLGWCLGGRLWVKEVPNSVGFLLRGSVVSCAVRSHPSWIVKRLESSSLLELEAGLGDE
jgi:hypothetical protein